MQSSRDLYLGGAIVSRGGQPIWLSSAGDLTLGKRLAIQNPQGSADSVVLVAHNNAHAEADPRNAINPGQGRWIIYTADWQHTSVPRDAGVHRYNCSPATCGLDSKPLRTTRGNIIAYAAQPTITVRPAIYSRAYGDRDPDIAAMLHFPSTEATGAVNGDATSDELLDSTSDGTCGPRLEVCNKHFKVKGQPDKMARVGTYPLTLTPTITSTLGYKIEYARGEVTITPRKLIVAANGIRTRVGAALPQLTYRISGLMQWDYMPGALTTTAPENASAGNYEINQGTLTAPANYALEYRPAVLSVQ